MRATRALLARDGYDQLTIDAIAKESGVSRPTVYRRWPSKAHVVFDAAFGDTPGADDVFAGTDDFRTDLRRFVRDALDFWGQPVVSTAVLGILAERERDPALHIRTQQLLDEQTLSGFAALVRRGVEQGVIRADVDVDMLYHLLISTTFYAVVVQQDSHTSDLADLVDRLSALVLQGAGTERTTGSARRSSHASE